MSTTIAKLVALIGADTSELDKGLKNSEAKISEFGKAGESSFGDFSGVALAAMAAVTVAAMGLKEVMEFGKEAAGLDRLAIASSNLAASMDSSMDVVIAKVREASMGTVSDFDIMASASKAMMLGVSADAEKLANLMEIAALRGRSMGLSTTQSFDDIIRGIGRMSPFILDNLGVMIDAERTYKEYADAIGKSANDLSALEKRQALLNRVIEEGNQLLAKVGGLTDDAASGFERFETNVKNLGDEFKTSLLPVLSEAMNMFNDLAFGQKETYDNLKAQELAIRESAASYEEYIAGVTAAAEALNIFLPSVETAVYRGQALVESNLAITDSEWNLLNAIQAVTQGAELEIATKERILWNDQLLAESKDRMIAKYQEEANAISAAYSQMQMQAEQLIATMERMSMDLGQKTYQLFNAELPQGISITREEMQILDDVFGTTYGTTYDTEQAMKALNAEYKKTGDMEAWREGLKKLRDEQLEPTRQKLVDMQGQMQDMLDTLKLLTRNDWVIRVSVVTTGSIPGPVGAEVNATSLADGFDKFQTGGSIFAGQRGLVGERGPEMFRSFRSGWIDSQPHRNRGGDAGGHTINFYFQDTTLDEVQLRDSLRRVERLTFS